MKKLVMIIALMFGLSSAWSQDIAAGEKMFNANCKACHSIGKGKIVGPDLKNVSERRKEDWLMKFIRKPGEMVKSDPDAKKLFEEHNQILMPDHTFLQDEDIKNMLGYIENQSKDIVQVKEDSKAGEKVESKPLDKPIKEASVPLSPLDTFLYGLLGFCIMLTIMAIILIIRVRNAYNAGKGA